MKDFLKQFNTSETWLDVDTLAKLKNISNRAVKPLMRNIAGIMADSTEENFKEEGRPKWKQLSEPTKKARKKTGHYPGQILQVSGQLAVSVTTQYDDNSAVIGSNKKYAAIQQLGGLAGKNKKVNIPARPYLNLCEDDYKDILKKINEYLL